MARALLALPCLTAAPALGPARRGSLAALVAVLGSAVTLVLSVVALAGAPTGARGAPFAEALGTGPGALLGGIDLPLNLSLSATSAFLVLVVALITALVQTYSARYLAADDRRGVFHASIALFAAAMLMVVLSADLVLTVVGWEVMGWCSYLLIGHWSRREAPRRAGHTAFIVTRIADIGLLPGVSVLIAGAGTSGRAEVIEHWTSAAADPATRSVALVLVVIGVLGKSAQLPFHDWLLDAMEGPTPASALIHAATMVAAGTVVLAQLLPLLLRAEPARALLGISVAVTMVLAAICAPVEPDLKRLLARVDDQPSRRHARAARRGGRRSHHGGRARAPLRPRDLQGPALPHHRVARHDPGVNRGQRARRERTLAPGGPRSPGEPGWSPSPACPSSSAD
ncbi:proton-conducting transporter membrane subunit [Janibacter limosus]|uniref:Uncharacterized protein n=1 Tax=Janibacter limosus TaxID=53458 RepID=A0AC61U5P5_9MICO|nr:proton-conducting transporter membrane subunit [Janibacter limosus]UUZ45354.1 proton-conducting transporter membrane subunit [Janibacter limosus]